jgi:hypothetical protein
MRVQVVRRRIVKSCSHSRRDNEADICTKNSHQQAPSQATEEGLGAWDNFG